jgi:hypothetical protein
MMAARWAGLAANSELERLEIRDYFNRPQLS